MAFSACLPPSLQPGLPLSAACEVCGEGNPEPGESQTFSLMLMECSNCAQIAHPGCLKVHPIQLGQTKQLTSLVPSTVQVPQLLVPSKSDSLESVILSPLYSLWIKAPAKCQAFTLLFFEEGRLPNSNQMYVNMNMPHFLVLMEELLFGQLRSCPPTQPSLLPLLSRWQEKE